MATRKKTVKKPAPKKERRRDWIAWFNNNTDRRDDEWYRYKRCTYKEALEQAHQRVEWSRRESLAGVYTVSEFHRRYGLRGLA